MEQKKQGELLREKSTIQKEKLKEEKPQKLKLDFTKKEYEYILNNIFLSDLQKEILLDRLKGKSIIEISIKQNLSVDTINKQIRKIKNKILKIF